jgi:hypothetical protein
MVGGWILGNTHLVRVNTSAVSPRMLGRDTWGVAGDRFHRCWKNSDRVSHGVVGRVDCLAGGGVSGCGWTGAGERVARWGLSVVAVMRYFLVIKSSLWSWAFLLALREVHVRTLQCWDWK